MEVLDAIKRRRTVRELKSDAISQDQLDTILEAVRWAPSWVNTQCWEIVVVREKEQKKNLAAALVEGNPSRDAMTQAPVVLVVLARRGVSGFFDGEVTTDKGDWYMFDSGLAVQNLCLAAYDQGLGTVIVGSFDAKRVGEIVRAPEDRSVMVLVPVGHPKRLPEAPERKAPSTFVRAERY